MISGRSRVFALLGAPVAHSLSPLMHNAAFRALGLDAVYVAIDCAAADVPTLMTALARNGGGNLTVPFKRLGAQVVAGMGERRLVSCNTFWGLSGRLVGDETDSVGIYHAWQRLGSPLGPWLLIGTGGSALAAAVAATKAGAAVSIRSRAPARAATFAAEVAALGTSLATAGAEPRVVVNCTPLGLTPNDPLPIPAESVPKDATSLDLVYARGGTPWVRALIARGVRAEDGREVLVGQGAAAFERWFPESRAPVEVMRAALADGLR